MDNEIFKMNNISLYAKGILATLFALDIDEMEWDEEITDEDGVIELLQKVCCEPKEILIDALFELKSTGYIEWDIQDKSFSIFYDKSEISDWNKNDSREGIIERTNQYKGMKIK